MRRLLAEKELLQLACDGRVGLWDDEAVQAVLIEAIDQADGEIDGYLAMIPGTTLPLAEPPRLIGNISAKIGVYNLLRRRPSVPDHWRGEYERCLKLLQKLVDNGRLPGTGDEETAIDPGQVVVVTREKAW